MVLMRYASPRGVFLSVRTSTLVVLILGSEPEARSAMPLLFLHRLVASRN